MLAIQSTGVNRRGDTSALGIGLIGPNFYRYTNYVITSLVTAMDKSCEDF